MRCGVCGHEYEFKNYFSDNGSIVDDSFLEPCNRCKNSKKNDDTIFPCSTCSEHPDRKRNVKG